MEQNNRFIWKTVAVLQQILGTNIVTSRGSTFQTKPQCTQSPVEQAKLQYRLQPLSHQIIIGCCKQLTVVPVIINHMLNWHRRFLAYTCCRAIKVCYRVRLFTAVVVQQWSGASRVDVISWPLRSTYLMVGVHVAWADARVDLRGRNMILSCHYIANNMPLNINSVIYCMHFVVLHTMLNESRFDKDLWFLHFIELEMSIALSAIDCETV